LIEKEEEDTAKGLRLFILRIQLAKSSKDLTQRCDDRNPSKVKIL